ncbi:hypothetical protein AMAG_06486 [Allomyces macrogynus ATCC 38327]|uniref:Uncharacterized protein n=1 Tax=Allomyces macrogynus (strain ATCC 38327) TaxID=578462 RepID=A0A0L0SGP1_ALLM3|nr:hypothetical protein AMAG_06486 [Allomyces macrogynus ATCC 38327]|eukprot:KNE61681.1 hypothetical protein AMAG_06486 [Allomyces macrogynus ATCC 38327]
MTTMIWWSTFAIVLICLVLTIDQVLPEFGYERLFPSAQYSSAGMSLLATATGAVLRDLHARNALRIVISGCHEDGLIMQMSFSAWSDGVLGILRRMARELVSHNGGWRQVGATRFMLLATALTTWIAIFLWHSFAALLAWDGIKEVRTLRTGVIPTVNFRNPFGWDACVDDLAAGNAQFQFSSGTEEAAATLLREVYATGILDSVQAARNASWRYADDFADLNLDGHRHFFILPHTPDNFHAYNTTVLAVNVSCGMFVDRYSLYNWNENMTWPPPSAPLGPLPPGFVAIMDEVNIMPSGFFMLGWPSQDTLDLINTQPEYVSSPGCRRGQCQAIQNDTIISLKCSMYAGLLNVSVTKAVPSDVLLDMEYDPRKSLADVERVTVTPLRNTMTPVPIVPQFAKNLLTEWTTAVQWSWTTRALGILFDADQYLRTATVDFARHDMELMLAYLILGLIHHPANYTIQLTATNSTSPPACLSRSATGVHVRTPNFHDRVGHVVVKRYLAQTKYSSFVALFAGTLGVLVVTLAVPMAKWDCFGIRATVRWCRRRSASKRVDQQHPEGAAGAHRERKAPIKRSKVAAKDPFFDLLRSHSRRRTQQLISTDQDSSHAVLRPIDASAVSPTHSLVTPRTPSDGALRTESPFRSSSRRPSPSHATTASDDGLAADRPSSTSSLPSGPSTGPRCLTSATPHSLPDLTMGTLTHTGIVPTPPTDVGRAVRAAAAARMHEFEPALRLLLHLAHDSAMRRRLRKLGHSAGMYVQMQAQPRRGKAADTTYLLAKYYPDATSSEQNLLAHASTLPKLSSALALPSMPSGHGLPHAPQSLSSVVGRGGTSSPPSETVPSPSPLFSSTRSPRPGSASMDTVALMSRAVKSGLLAPSPPAASRSMVLLARSAKSSEFRARTGAVEEQEEGGKTEDPVRGPSAGAGLGPGV